MDTKHAILRKLAWLALGIYCGMGLQGNFDQSGNAALGQNLRWVFVIAGLIMALWSYSWHHAINTSFRNEAAPRLLHQGESFEAKPL